MPGPFLCQRNPATTQSAVRSCLILSIARLPGWYAPSSRLATTPSRPAPSNRSNQSAARARSRVAGVRWTGGVRIREHLLQPCPALALGHVAQILVPEREQVPGDEAAGLSAASIFTRDAAGWMRSSSASKSSAPSPAITTSPSSTQRSGRFAFSGSASSGK